MQFTSSLSTESAIATVLLLPNWKGLNANAYMQMLRKYPEHYTILGTIPQASVTYCRQNFWIGNKTSSPAPEWYLKIIVIWNKEAQRMLFDQNPRWCAALSTAIPEAIFQPCPRPPTQNAAKVIKTPRSFRKKLNKSAFTKNTRSITTAPNLTALTNYNLRLKVPGWRLWAYTDGSCLTWKSRLRVGAGVFIPATKTAIYVNSGGVGISNTITRAQMTGIASALRAKCTHIATDSASSLSQIQKQLLFPELHRKHTHSTRLEQIVSMINKSDSHQLLQVKSRIGVIGNEFADAIAKHAALHYYGHDEAFPPPSPDGNPFAHVYWLAEENDETTHIINKISLAPLQNIKDKLKAHLSKHHRDENTNSGYYNSWKRLLTFMNLTTSNSFWEQYKN